MTRTAGYSIFNPTPVKEEMMSKVDAEKAASKGASVKERAEKQAEREAAKAAKLAEKAAAKTAKQAEREAKVKARELEKAAREEARAIAKAEREARKDDLGPHTAMHALREAKKRYVKSATGQLRSNDELAQVLDAVSPTGVVELVIKVLSLDVNPYSRLNPGQQSMNLRNKLRGAIKRGVVTIEQVVIARDAGEYVLSMDELAERSTRKPAAAVN